MHIFFVDWLYIWSGLPRRYSLCRLFACGSHLCVFFVFKQKTAYEMRISDWSSDVCSSDLGARGGVTLRAIRRTNLPMPSSSRRTAPTAPSTDAANNGSRAVTRASETAAVAAHEIGRAHV